MTKNLRKNFTIRLTDAERDTLSRESQMLGMSSTEYIRTLMQHGKSRLYIQYLHGLVEQINTKLAPIQDMDFARLVAKVNWLTLAVKEIQGLTRNGAEQAKASYLPKVDAEVQKLKEAISKGY